MRSKRPTRRTLDDLTLRVATGDDAGALRRLAQLDTAPVPGGSLLVASDGSEPVAAVRIADGTAIANPFRHTAAAVELLRVRAKQLRTAEPRARERGGEAG